MSTENILYKSVTLQEGPLLLVNISVGRRGCKDAILARDIREDRFQNGQVSSSCALETASK